ncbi:MAG: substrate-binding domain-containing protein [Muribaculaceae bacterium]|nr:substrate-binding domain-containing protein [Muribaculaceae bacterium]MDE6299171.1 substrate-binding domain-containing protein [Muribaculaceae bacterium]
MKTSKFPTLLAVGCLLAGAVGCTPIKKGEYASGTSTIFCDDGFKNILDEEIEVFEYSYPQASIIPMYVSEGAAIDTLLSDGTQAIISTKELTKEQIEFMKSKYKRVVRQNCIAVDAVALIANKDNPVQSLSMQEISDIMNGKITRWSQLAGNDTTKIKLVFDNAESSTVSYFKEKFLPKDVKLASVTNSYAQQNNAQVFDVVKTDPNALGIISVSWLGADLSAAKNVPMDQRMEDYKNETDTVATPLTSEVNIIRVSNPTEENDYTMVGYMPYQAYIYSGQYPLVRKIYMVSTASNSTVLHSFYTFMTGFVGQKIISKTGILPYHMNPRVVEITQK